MRSALIVIGRSSFSAGAAGNRNTARPSKRIYPRVRKPNESVIVMLIARFSTVVLMLAALSACASQPPATPQSEQGAVQRGGFERPAPRIVGVVDNGAVIALQPGQLLQIELEGTPTAGYVWQLAPLPAGARLVSQTSRPSNPEGRAAGMVGGNDWAIFTVESSSPTRVRIELVYGRPWELQAGAAPERRFAVDTVMALN